MRIPILPPAWRQLLRGGLEPWQLVAVAAALGGAAWALSPYAALELAARKGRERVGREPNATGRALGYSAGAFRSPVQDPIEVLTLRVAVQGAGTGRPPVYRGGRGDYFRPPLPTQPKVTWPLATANLRRLGRQPPVHGIPIQAGPGVARTAAEVLSAQLVERIDKGA